MDDHVEFSNAVYARTSEAHAAVVAGIVNSSVTCGKCATGSSCAVCASINTRLVQLEFSPAAYGGSIKRHIIQPSLK